MFDDAILPNICEFKIPKSRVFQIQTLPIHFQNIQYLGIYLDTKGTIDKQGHFLIPR